jgi:hypothetical protein
MEFDHVTNRYLYPDRYIKMIPYFLNKSFKTLKDLTFFFRGAGAPAPSTEGGSVKENVRATE